MNIREEKLNPLATLNIENGLTSILEYNNFINIYFCYQTRISKVLITLFFFTIFCS